MRWLRTTGLASLVGACLLVSGCAHFGIGPVGSKKGAKDAPSDSEVEATHYLAERGVTAAQRIAQATATQVAVERAYGTDGAGPRAGAKSDPQMRRVARDSDADSADASASPDGQPTRRVVRRKGSADGSSADEAADRADAPSAPPQRLEGEEDTREIARNGDTPDRNTARGAARREDGTGRHASTKASVDSARFSLSDAAGQQKLREDYDLEPPSAANAVALTGTFRKADDVPSEQVAVIVPGRRLTVYGGGDTLASLELSDSGELPEDFTAVEAVRVVRDGTLQILCYWSEKTEDKDTAYKVGIFKVIGSHAGPIFERTVATRSAESDALTRRGFFEVLKGDKNRFIRWTPADEKGKPVDSESKVLHWNKWEGVFREPKPPPTAPRQQS